MKSSECSHLRLNSTGRFRAGLLLIAMGGGASDCSIYDESLLVPGSAGVGGAAGAVMGGSTGVGGAGGAAIGGSAGVGGGADAAADSSAGVGGTAGSATDGSAGMGGTAGSATDGSAGMGGTAGTATGGSAGVLSGGTAGMSTGGSAGAAPCGTNQKRCNSVCVERTPQNGCNATACTACPGPAPANGVLTCNPMGACTFDCLPGYMISGNTCVPSTGTGGSGGTGDGGSLRCGSTNCVPCTPPHVTCCERTTGLSCLCAPPDYVSTLCR
jgi:hypothetical protein